jgi:beta-lactamase class D
MTHLLLSKFLLCLLCIFPYAFALSAEENFLLVNGASNKSMVELGPGIDERMTPCSTFKIALSLMGFDSGILQDQNHPVWLYQEGYDDFLESWKSPQTPESWLKTSCVWFSRLLAEKLGSENFQAYLATLDYGNQDASGGLTSAWLSSSLQISPREQVEFIRKMLQGNHPVSSYASQMTRQSLFVDELPNGWKLFGKTGWSSSIDTPDGKQELGWFIGWVEKEGDFFPFAYTIQEEKINPEQRIPRVKQLLTESTKTIPKSNEAKIR